MKSFRINFRPVLRRFNSDETGNITVEFVVALPLLMLWFIGSYVFFDAYKATSRAVKATNTISDIVTRQVQLDDNFIDSDMMWLLSRSLPQAPTGKQLRISSIQFSGGVYTVLWSRGVNVPDLTTADIPLSIMPTLADNDTVILTETMVPYTPIYALLGLSDVIQLNHQVTQRPRFVTPLVKV